MGVNRGYKPAEQVIMDDWFRPPMDTLGLVLQTAEAQQQAGEAALAKIGETQFKHLPADTPNAEPVYKDIYANIDKLAQGAMGDGDLRKVKSDIDRYARETQRRFRPEGDIGKMISNYEAFSKWNEELGKLVGKPVGDGGITAQHAAALRAKVLADYEAKGGIGKKDDITGYNQIGLKDAALAIDENKLVEEYGKGYIADSRQGVATDPKTGKILPGAVWRQNGKIWKKTTNGEKEVAYQDVFRDLLSSITQHEGYMQYQQQLKELGLSNYGAGDLYIKDANGELLLDKDGQATLDRNHPIVAAAMRGASKFGFTEISYDEDMKFDPYQLEYYKSQQRMKEERMKGQMMVFQTTAKERTLNPTEIKAGISNLSDVVSSGEKVISKLRKEIEAGGLSDQMLALKQAELNKEIKAQNSNKMRLNAAEQTLSRLAVAGGFDMKKQYEEFVAEYAKLNRTEPKLTLAEFTQAMRQMSPLNSDRELELVDRDKANVNELLEARRLGYSKAVETAPKTLLSSRNAILATPDTPLGQKMKQVQAAISAGQLNFIAEDGFTSFNLNDFNQAVASGNVEIVPLLDTADGKPAFEITIKGGKEGKKNFTTYTGSLEGLENQTWANDLAVDFRDRAKNEGIATQKGQQLLKVADMIDGRGIEASNSYGVATGEGTLATQLDVANLGALSFGEASGHIKLPHGYSMKLMANGDGQYLPTFYNDGLPMDRRDFETDKTQPLPKGPMSLGDIQAWMGQNEEFKTKPNRN